MSNCSKTNKIRKFCSTWLTSVELKNMIQYGSYVHSLINTKGEFYRIVCERLQRNAKTQKQNSRNKTKYNSRLKASIQFTKPIQIELSQLLRRLLSVKVYSNALEKIRSHQSLNCLKSNLGLKKTKMKHSQRVKKSNHNSNSALLRVNPWID